MIFDDDDLKSIKGLITYALRKATERKYEECPPIVYVPIAITHNQLLEKVLCFNPPLSPITSRTAVCIKCSCECNCDTVAKAIK